MDRLRGLETLRLFNRTSEQTQHIESTTEDFRETTMTVLKMAFLSSAVLEFFTSISIALMAVYFGFSSYLGQSRIWYLWHHADLILQLFSA